jgi:hypothetical protein
VNKAASVIVKRDNLTGLKVFLRQVGEIASTAPMFSKW